MTKPKLNIDSTPPQAVDLEELVLGGLLLEEGAQADTVFGILRESEVFYRESHQLIYAALLEMYQQKNPIDIKLAAKYLREKKQLDQVGGEYVLVKLATSVSSTANIKHYCYIILQQSVKRDLIQLGQEAAQQAYDEASDSLELHEQLSKKLSALDAKLLAQQKHLTWPEIQELITKDVEELTKARDEGGMLGIPSGLHAIDEVVGGWLPGELIILAARPGMGKTAMVVKWAVSAAAMGIPVGIMQLEMTHVQFGKRVLAVESETLHANQLYKHGLTKDSHWSAYTSVIDKTRDYPLHIIPKPGMSINDCMLEARRMYKENGIRLLIIDYLQLMSGSGSGRVHNREQEISEVSRKLKQLSLELQIPVIALSQLSRAVETRGGGKRPMLSDLRESGSIEQDADFVGFIYRPDYYGIQELEDGSPAEGKCEFIIAKHRTGANGTCLVGFNANRVKFHNLDEVQEGEPF